jgi:hypothetical protein
MVDSILDSVKDALDIPLDDASFDNQLLIHINGVFLTLGQLGYTNAEAFSISDNTSVWSDLTMGASVLIQSIQTHVILSVRLIFDPPANSFLVRSIEDQIRASEWRIQAAVETQE